MKKSKLEKRQRRTIFLIIMAVILSVYSISLLFPLGWSILSACKGNNDFESSPFALSFKFDGFSLFDNLVFLFNEFTLDYTAVDGTTMNAGILNMLYNSIFYCLGVALVANGTRALCAYVCARYRHIKFTKYIYSLVIVLMTISFPSNLAVTIKYYQLVGIYNNMYLAVLLSISFSGGNFLFLYAAFVGLSKEYSEAAQVDGANQFTVMLRVMMPMVKNIFFALVMLEFIAHWNDYQPNVVYLRAYPMISYGLYVFKTQATGVDSPIMFTSSFVVIIPTLVIFIIFRNKIMSNLSIGGLKG